MDVQHVADAVLYMAQPAARRQRAVHDGDGDQDALRRAGLIDSMDAPTAADVVIIGAGIAGASVAYELAGGQGGAARVIVLEREDQPGYHTTGRSAAMFTETYGNEVMRALTRCSRDFLRGPPAGFAEAPILVPRGSLLVGRADQCASVEQAYAACSTLVDNLELWDGAQVRARVPVMREAAVAAAVWEPDAMDIDVNALHQGYLRGLRARGGRVVCRAEVRALVYEGAGWRVHDDARATSPRGVVVNAARCLGRRAWPAAGARPIGLVPKRRTAITFDAAGRRSASTAPGRW